MSEWRPFEQCRENVEAAKLEAEPKCSECGCRLRSFGCTPGRCSLQRLGDDAARIAELGQ